MIHRIITFSIFAFFSVSLPADDLQLVRTADHWRGRNVSWRLQPAAGGDLRLTASNGFFDRGFFAAGQSPAPTAEKDLIPAHFDHLMLRREAVDVTARWHVLISRPGDLNIRPQLVAPPPERQTRWELSIGDIRRTFIPGADKLLMFEIEQAGRHVIALRRLDNDVAGQTRIQGLALAGPAATEARIIRARWRPAAIHTQYASSTCPATKMWVFETQSVAPVCSYSPITTGFGYFGASFDGDGRAKGGVNFSMWAAGQKASQAPPLREMPHLLATGNPRADFSGFGHEGSGVKIRNWEPLAHHPRSVIQALRVETRDGHDTWTGYLFDERSERWVLYAVGRRPTRVRGGKTETFLRPASFCEIPGPPSVQRSGDVQRVMRRRGWLYGEDNRWHRVDRQTSGNRRKVSEPINKFIAAEDGWFLMGTGGVEMHDQITEVQLSDLAGNLPVYLRPEFASQLFELPVTFGATSVDADRTSATVHYDLKDAGPNAKALLYYGPVDCLTFVSRELHGTERKGVSAEFLSADRVWANATVSRAVASGHHAFSLENLKPDSTCFYRLLVTNERGKSWAFETGSFRTK